MRRAMLIVGLAATAVAAWGQAAAPPANATIHSIVAEAERLMALNRLGLTAEQLQKLIAIVKPVEDKRTAREDHIRKPEALQAAWALRTAALNRQEPGGLWEQLEKFWQEEEKLERELDAARRTALEAAVEILTAEQLAMLAEREPEGEVEEHFEQIRHMRRLPDDAWTEWAARRARQMAYLAAADGQERADQVKGDVAAFLDRVRGMTDEEFEQSGEELRAEVELLVADAQPQPSETLTKALARERLSGLVIEEGALETLRAKLNLPAAQ